MQEEADKLKEQKQYLEEKLERFNQPRVVIKRLLRLLIFDGWNRLKKTAYKQAHQYDKIYKKNNFQPYHLNYKTTVNTPAPVVLHLINNFKTGGASRIVVDIAEYTSDKYRHIVITRYNPIPQNYQGIKVEEICNIPKNKEVYRLLKKYNPAIIHIHWGTAWSEGSSVWQWYYAFFKILDNTNVKLIQNVNLSIIPYLFRQNKCTYIFVSQFVSDNYAFKNEANKVIYPGSDFTFFQQKENQFLSKKQLGMVYRLDDHKLKKESVEPLILAAKKDKEITIHIVGDGNLRSHYEKRVNEAGLKEQFIFYGYIAYENLPDIYKKWSLFVAPVFQESFGQVTSFALNMEIPVVAYDADALPEIIQDKDLIIKKGDAEALSKKIVSLLNNPDLLKQKSKEAKQKAERFNLYQMIAAFEAVYKK